MEDVVAYGGEWSPKDNYPVKTHWLFPLKSFPFINDNCVPSSSYTCPVNKNKDFKGKYTMVILWSKCFMVLKYVYVYVYAHMHCVYMSGCLQVSTGQKSETLVAINIPDHPVL